MPNTHGGPGRGQGRKPLDRSLRFRTVRATVTLTEEDAEKLKALGEGNLSEGIRRALAAYKP